MTWLERAAARLPRPLRFEHVDRRVLVVSLYAALNMGLALYFIPDFIRHADSTDFALWRTVPDAIRSGRLYASDSPFTFVWSPVAAALMAGVAWMGFWSWSVIHVLAVVALRDWRLIGLTFLSWPFWHDVLQGNAFAFVFVTGIAALRGSKLGTILYLALLLLVPRPVQVPLALWLLWKVPGSRWPFVVLFTIHAALVLGSGLLDEWVAAMRAWGVDGPAQARSFGPPAWLGSLWLLIGLPLGAWLTLRDRVGWAGLAVSPYLLVPYFLMPLLDLRLVRGRRTDPGRGGAPPRGDPAARSAG